jgi:hypothetical protein
MICSLNEKCSISSTKNVGFLQDTGKCITWKTRQLKGFPWNIVTAHNLLIMWVYVENTHDTRVCHNVLIEKGKFAKIHHGD